VYPPHAILMGVPDGRNRQPFTGEPPWAARCKGYIMKTLLLSAAALVWLAACGPRGNRGDRSTTNETGMRGDTLGVVPRTDTVNAGAANPGAANADLSTPAGILTVLSTANLQEIQEAQYAQQRASSAAVKALARRLEADHKANLQQGRQVAKQLGVSQQLPSDTSVATPTNEPAELMGRQGADFDRAFVQHEIEAHQTNIDRIQNQMIPAAQDPQLKRYLQQTVTAMEGHLQRAQQVQRQLGSGDSSSRADSAVSNDSMPSNR
jgi:putative membrane protein